ncbi:unnamed protein product, partial [Effrenium voratum]
QVFKKYPKNAGIWSRGCWDSNGRATSRTDPSAQVSRLVLGARRLEKLEHVKADLAKRFPAVKVDVVRLDATDAESRKGFVQAMRSAKVNILVNNAGIDRNAFFEKMSDKDVDASVHTNIVGTCYLTRDFLAYKLEAGGIGHVVTLSSISASFPVPFGQMYATTKAANWAFSMSLRSEFRYEKKPVTFHVVSPGVVVGGGLAEEKAQKQGLSLRRVCHLFGWTTSDKVADAVVNAIHY